MRIGIQGEEGSYSAQAAAVMAPGAKLAHGESFADVYELLARGECDAAVLPFENTLVGCVGEQYDLLGRYEFEIAGECVIPIHHQLIGVRGAVFSQVRFVYSHPVALEQCRRFFARNPQIEARPFYDTAGSVGYTQKLGDPAHAAVASALAAEHYGGSVLERDVEDDSSNCTRFWMLKRAGEAVLAREPNKVSVLMEVPHQPGALSDSLADFARRGYNLVKLEPRPIPGRPFQHRFFADFLCTCGEEADAAIAALRLRGNAVRVLGKYRAAQRPDDLCLRHG